MRRSTRDASGAPASWPNARPAWCAEVASCVPGRPRTRFSGFAGSPCCAAGDSGSDRGRRDEIPAGRTDKIGVYLDAFGTVGAIRWMMDAFAKGLFLDGRTEDLVMRAL